MDGQPFYEKVADEVAAEATPPPDLASMVSLAAWLNRDIPEPDFLLGEVFSTTNRVLLSAETGLGKTNFAMAAASAIATGSDFLQWSGRGRPARVLYIEGEMSERLVKSRLRDAARRAEVQPQTLYILSRGQFDMPPLETPDGQQYVDNFIQRLGGIDFVFCDNVQALTTGDMKDEVPWQQTLPWVRDLTRRSIGQLWIHHTGHDTTHSYGTKTREWQLDTVMLLEEVLRPEADIAFSLKFTKARERGPHNRADFDPVTIVLANDRWTVEGAAARSKAPSPLGLKFFRALLDALAAPNASVHTIKMRRAVTVESWKYECTRVGLIDGDDKADRQRALFNKYKRELIERDQIGCENDLVWCLR
jgi:hypothetical protein